MHKAVKVFIANIDYEVSESEAMDFVRHHGNVRKFHVVGGARPEGHRGFGFAQCETREDADNLIAALDGKRLGGRRLRAAIAKAR